MSRRGTFVPDFAALQQLAEEHAVWQDWRPLEPELKGAITLQGERWTVEIRWRSIGGASRHMWFSAPTPEGAWARAEEHLQGPWRGWDVGDFS